MNEELVSVLQEEAATGLYSDESLVMFGIAIRFLKGRINQKKLLPHQIIYALMKSVCLRENVSFPGVVVKSTHGFEGLAHYYAAAFFPNRNDEDIVVDFAREYHNSLFPEYFTIEKKGKLFFESLCTYVFPATVSVCS